MALRWIEGFEAARNTTILGRVYENTSGSIISPSNNGHRGGSAAQSDSWIGTTPDLLGGAADENTWVVHFAFRTAAPTGLDTSQALIPYVALASAAGEQVRLEFVSMNDSRPGGTYYCLRAMRGATELATSTLCFPATDDDRSWVDFEWKVTVRTSTNGSFELKYTTITGAVSQTMTWDASTTGIDTANQGADGADRVTFSFATGNAADDVVFDNILILDSTGSINNDYLGPIYIDALDPQGNGDTLEWDLAGGAASLEDAWNEGATTQSTVEDDKAVSTDVTSEIELATMTDLLLLGETTIAGVQVRMYARMEASGTRDIQFLYRKTTGTPAQVGTAVVTVPSTSMVGFADTQETDPNTAAAWVPADINGLQLGVQLDA